MYKLSSRSRQAAHRDPPQWIKDATVKGNPTAPPKLAIHPPSGYPRGTVLHTREIPDASIFRLHVDLASPENRMLPRSPPLSPLAPTIPTFLNELHPSLMRKRTFLMRTAHSLFVNSLCPPFSSSFSALRPYQRHSFDFCERKRRNFRSMIPIDVELSAIFYRSRCTR